MKIKVMTPSVYIFIATVLAAGFALYENIKNSQQQNSIEDLAKKSKELGETNVLLNTEVKELAKLNNQMAQTSDEIAKDNKQLTRHNIELTDQVKKLIDKVDARTRKDVEENALTGKISFSLDNLKDTDIVTRSFGGMHATNSVKQFLEWKPPPQFILIGDQVPIKVTVENKKLIVNLVWYDLFGNWIVEIENNYWRRNPNYTGKFNYDTTGFEIIDNQGNIALNIDFKSNNEFIIQGYLSIISSNIIPIGGNKGAWTASRTDQYVEIVNKMRELEVTQIFEYTGENWIGKRRHKR